MNSFDFSFACRWETLCRQCTFPADWSTEVGRKLQTLYSAPERYYHTSTHIETMLKWLDVFEPGQLPSLRLATYFHDAIYDTRATDNEEKSAELAVSCLSRVTRDRGLVDQVSRMVLSTKMHIPDQTIPHLSEVFLDCDLLILAAEPALYESYTRQIRLEYMQYDDESYRAGRIGIMKNFLQREKIFYTEGVRERFEARARSNIARELKALG
jgi:predicted metal-dependent HD superfamily phosphohydrolase